MNMMAVDRTVTDLLVPKSRARHTHSATSRRRPKDRTRERTAWELVGSAAFAAAAAAPRSKCSALRAVAAAVSLRASRKMPAWVAMMGGRGVAGQVVGEGDGSGNVSGK